MATAEDIASIVGQQLNAQQRAMEERFQKLLTAQREAFQTQLDAVQDLRKRKTPKAAASWSSGTRSRSRLQSSRPG